MIPDPDILIVGAGPAGMAAAIMAREQGFSVLIIDEQPEPGGQIWRGVERVGKTPRRDLLGTAYTDGLKVVAKFRRSGAVFSPQTVLWNIEEGPEAYIKSGGDVRQIIPRAVILATGAQERPTPFKGWTLPGVMTVGAGQILLKSAGQVPDGPVWIAGTGPLAYLYAVQLLKAGVTISGFLDTCPTERVRQNAIQALGALAAQPKDMVKGIAWLARLRKGCRYFRNVTEIEAEGADTLERINFVSGKGQRDTAEARYLFVHEGVIPGVHATMSLGCAHSWSELQHSYAPKVDPWGETSVPMIFAAGDIAGIAGADAAVLRGLLSALGCARKLVPDRAAHLEREAFALRKRLARATAARPFLDRLYRPRNLAFLPKDDVIACRCEEVTVAQVRSLCRAGKGDPNRIKAFSRAGMGACQGRLCNYTVANVLADETGIASSAIGLYRVRPPFKPLSLDELARLKTSGGDQ